MIKDLADHFLQLSCLILAAGVSLAAVISAVRGRRERDEPAE